MSGTYLILFHTIASLITSLHAGELYSKSLIFECNRQLTVKNVRNVVKADDFTTDRTLKSYGISFDSNSISYPADNFSRSIERLTQLPQGHWIDSGGGQGLATKKFLEDGFFYSPVTTTMISYKTKAVSSERYKVISGQYLENIDISKIPRGDLITDLYGPIAYSNRPDIVLRKYFELIKPDGEIYLFMGNPLQDPFGDLNKIKRVSGKKISLINWILEIRNIRVNAYTSINGKVLIISVPDAKKVRIPELTEEPSRVKTMNSSARYSKSVSPVPLYNYVEKHK